MFNNVIRLLRLLALAIGAVALAYVAIVAVLTLHAKPEVIAPTAPAPIQSSPVAAQPRLPPRRGFADAHCNAPHDQAAAIANAQGRTTLPIAPFGVAETGWQFYEHLIAREIGTDCPGDTGTFAGRVRAWQAAHWIAASGQVDAATLEAMARGWLQRRPFVAAMRNGCPPSPDPSQLAAASAQEAYGGKTILARPAALAAYRRMVAAARRDRVAAPPLLQIASAWRGPDEEAARCADDSCGTAAKARCSAHRTGLAFDFVLGRLTGVEGFSTAAANRLALSRTPTYRWLVAHAGRFGFVNYPYEPWHWEWTGEGV